MTERPATSWKKFWKYSNVFAKINEFISYRKKKHSLIILWTICWHYSYAKLMFLTSSIWLIFIDFHQTFIQNFHILDNVLCSWRCYRSGNMAMKNRGSSPYGEKIIANVKILNTGLCLKEDISLKTWFTWPRTSFDNNNSIFVLFWLGYPK